MLGSVSEVTAAGPTLAAAVKQACGMAPVHAPPPPGSKQGIPLGPIALKSEGLPKKSQRSANSLVPLNPKDWSLTFQGCPVSKVIMVLSCQPSSNWLLVFLSGSEDVIDKVKRWRMSSSPLAWS